MSLLVGLAVALAPAGVAFAQAGATPAFLGVRMGTSDRGVRLTAVLPGSGADRAGLRAGDVIVSVARRAVSTPEGVTEAVAGALVGDAVPIEVERSGLRMPLTVVLGSRPTAGAAVRALVGSAAPSIHLAEATGASAVDLGAQRGRVTLVYFWSVWCGACRVAVPTLARWQRTFGPQGLSVIGVTDDPPEVVRQALARAAVPYSIALDPGSKVGAAFWVEALPTFFVVDPVGRVAHAVEGWDPVGSRAMESVIRGLLPGSGP